jgi:hypothetical protein
MRQSYIFFLFDDGQIQLIPQPTYVALLRGELAMQKYAGKRVRIADLYTSLQDGVPVEIENETYGFLFFDETGHAVAHGRNFTLDENHDFYQVAYHSPYSNIDCDPQVRNVRESIGDDFSWLPTDEERETLRQLIFELESPAK